MGYIFKTVKKGQHTLIVAFEMDSYIFGNSPYE